MFLFIFVTQVILTFIYAKFLHISILLLIFTFCYRINTKTEYVKINRTKEKRPIFGKISGAKLKENYMNTIVFSFIVYMFSLDSQYANLLFSLDDKSGVFFRTAHNLKLKSKNILLACGSYRYTMLTRQIENSEETKNVNSR